MQLNLLDQPVTRSTATPRSLFRETRTIAERFGQFCVDHPEVYREFKRLACQLLEAGRRHFSSDAILHVIRFNTAIGSCSDDHWRINNVFSSRFARKLAAEDVRFKDFFEFRRLLSD